MEPLSTFGSLASIAQALTPVVRAIREQSALSRRLPRGIVPKKRLSKRKRLPGEVFAAELLSEPVRIECSAEGSPRIIVDRRNVEQVVINTEGKTNICRQFVPEKLSQVIELDRSLHTFLRESLKGGSPPLVLPPMPFRWSSGGILSVVNVRGESHVPMFFRDIPPAGWNIPLGSSERLIGPEGRVISDFDDELNSPALLSLREFVEETLVLDRSPAHDRPKSFRFLMAFDLGGAQATVASHLQGQHRQFRRAYDHIDIADDDDLVLRPSFLPLPMELKIHSDRGDFGVSNVLVSINCLELGIEVVKVIEYDLPADVEPYFLDGEILAENPAEPELVRMPVALFPVGLLRQLFSDEVPLNYLGAAQASLEFSHPLTTDEVTLFPWDVERRLAIAEGQVEGVGSEAERYRRWLREFGQTFTEGRLPALFTPTTVKVLNMLFCAPSCDGAWAEGGTPSTGRG